MISKYLPKPHLRHYVVARVAKNATNLNQAIQDMAFQNVVLAPDKISKIPSLSVTAFMTQYDELRQIEDFLRQRRRFETPAMLVGTKTHANLEAVADINIASAASPSLGGIAITAGEDGEFRLNTLQYSLTVAELSKGDRRFIDYYNKILALTTMHAEYLQTPHTPEARKPVVQVREVPVYGTTEPEPNFELRGIVDGLEVDHRLGLTVVETKTTQKSYVSSALLHLAYHQALIYRFLLETLIKEGSDGPEKLLNRFQVSNPALRELMANEALSIRFTQVHQAISEIGFAENVRVDILVGEQLNEFSMDYDPRVLSQVFQSRLDLFTGRRGPFASNLSRILAVDFIT